MTETNRSAKVLKNIKLLHSFSETELEELIACGKEETIVTHTNIIIEGELSWGLYLILDGTVGVSKSNKMSGNSYDVGQLGSGSFFGEMSLIDSQPRSATVRALTETKLFLLKKESFDIFLANGIDRKMKFYKNCIGLLVSRLRELDDNYVISQYQLWKSAIMKNKDVA